MDENQQEGQAPVQADETQAAAPEAAAKPTKEEKAAAKKAAAEQAKAEKLAAKAEKPVKIQDQKPAKDTKNGVTRPTSGVTRMVWDKADEMSKQAGAPIERAVLTAALDNVVETGTVHTQFGRWRKYYGLSETKEARQKRLEAVREKNKAARQAEADKRKADKEAKAKEKADKLAAKKADKDAAEAAKAAQQPELQPEPEQSEADAAGAAAATE